MIKSIFNLYSYTTLCLFFFFLMHYNHKHCRWLWSLDLTGAKNCWIFAAKVGIFFLHLYKSSKMSEASLKKCTEIMFFLRNIFFICLFSSDFQYFQKFYFHLQGANLGGDPVLRVISCGNKTHLEASQYVPRLSPHLSAL